MLLLLGYRADNKNNNNNDNKRKLKLEKVVIIPRLSRVLLASNCKGKVASANAAFSVILLKVSSKTFQPFTINSHLTLQHSSLVMLPPVLPPTSKQFSVTLEAARQDILKVYAHRLFLKQQPSSLVCTTFILLFSYVFLFPSFQQLFLTENREQILVVNCTKVLNSLVGKQKHIKRYSSSLMFV